ncbi:Hypothetical protein GLP15_1235 [Giardia lamblia P15]|uniref:Uncharacterized protein n=1 Tax=Giardia intestinalis (strain P15) TaxID=658858 RepID=E1EZS6_GIAIA|nr:Hypothetical protein GLP15_1235 [Giardia lamblia P15]
MPLLQLRSFSTSAAEIKPPQSQSLASTKHQDLERGITRSFQPKTRGGRRAVSLDTGSRTKGCLVTACTSLHGQAHVPQLLSSLENHVQPPNKRVKTMLQTGLKTVVQPTRITIRSADDIAEYPSSYFPNSLTLPSIDFTLGDCQLSHEVTKGFIQREEVCEAVDPGAPAMGLLGHRIANHSITMASSGVLKESMKTNEYYMIHAIQSNLAIIRRTTNTLIKKLQDQLASNARTLAECRTRIDNAEARAVSLDAMAERIHTLASNTTLQELCVINKDQEDVSRIVTHLNSQLDKDIKTIDEMYTFGHDFSQRVMLYRSRLPVFEKTMTVLKLKCNAIKSKISK